MEIEGVRKLAMRLMMKMVGGGFFVDSPSEMKKVINRTWKLEGTLSMVPINLVGLIQKVVEERMIKVGNWNHKSLRPFPTTTLFWFFFFYLNCQPTFLHLHLLDFLFREEMNFVQGACFVTMSMWVSFCFYIETLFEAVKLDNNYNKKWINKIIINPCWNVCFYHKKWVGKGWFKVVASVPVPSHSGNGGTMVPDVDIKSNYIQTVVRASGTTF